MSELDELSLMLGEIKADIKNVKENQKTHGEKMDAIDGRLKKQEIKAAAAGGVSGLVVSGFAALLAASLRGVGIDS